jgi:hypothetical protein
MHPIHLGGGSKAVDENDRLAFALVEKRDRYPIVLETLHGNHAGGTEAEVGG